jgi:cysteine-rich repeat protein
MKMLVALSLLTSCNALFDITRDPLGEETSGVKPGETADVVIPWRPSTNPSTNPSTPWDAETGDAEATTGIDEVSSSADGGPNLGEASSDGSGRDTSAEDASTPIEIFCGNGVVEASESCDDGNNAPYDGCSATCEVEEWGLGVNGALSPEFRVTTTEYSVELPLFHQMLQLSLKVPGGAVAQVDGATLADGNWTSGVLPLGETTLNVEVVAGGDVVRNYRLRVTRGKPTQQYLKASNTGERDAFGESIALSADGKTLAVGARWEDGDEQSDGTEDGSNDAANDAGAVYVFRRAEDGRWVQEGYIKADTPHVDDRFGESVSLSGDGNTLAVGAAYESGAGFGVSNQSSGLHDATPAGAAYVFVRNNGAWTQQAYIKPLKPRQGSNFGWEVALSLDGNTLAISAPYQSAGLDLGGAGAVYVFRRIQSAWSESAMLTAAEPSYLAEFGSSIALSGDGRTLAVGSRWEDHFFTEEPSDPDAGPVLSKVNNSGAAYVFTRSGNNTWAQQARLEAEYVSEGCEFGTSMAISTDGNTLAVGAVNEDLPPQGQSDDSLLNTGGMYVFTRDNGSWSQQALLTADNPEPGSKFGVSVAMNGAGTVIAVGAPEENSAMLEPVAEHSVADRFVYDSGAVYAFVREGGGWLQRAFVKALNAGDSDKFGGSVALSGNGFVLAAGAINEASSGTGASALPNDDSAPLAGAAYVVQFGEEE